MFLSSFVVLAVYLADGSLSVCSGGRGLFPSSCFVLAAMVGFRYLSFFSIKASRNINLHVVVFCFFSLNLIKIK